jgi:hypothetical protein
MPKIKDPVKIERNCQRIYGCTLDDALRINGAQPLRLKSSPAMLYYDQKKAAGKRGIGWNLTFPQWMAAWNSSGKFGQRGKGKDDYCMGRKGDVGPYAEGNVYICTVSQNVKDGYVSTPASKRLSSVGRGRNLRPEKSCVS